MRRGSLKAEAPKAASTADPSLKRLFAPSAIAVVGASPNPDKIGHVLMRNLQGFEGRLVPVHPTAQEVLDRRAYPNLAAVPDSVDLALLAIPPDATTSALRDCAAAGVGAAVIYSGGWAETGEPGAARQDELRVLAAEHGIRLLGPNTSGFVIPKLGIYATFVADLPQSIHAGSLAIVAQSGGVNLNLCFQAQSQGMGVRLGIGLGNATDVGWSDVLGWLADDDDTAVVALAIEGVVDGRALVLAIERLTARRPVVALTVGRTDVSEFARSHTGALAGNYRVKRAALSQAGAVVVDNVSELLDAAQALGARRLPPVEDPGVGVVTGQAGPGLLLTDSLRARGLSVPALPEKSRQRLRALLPPLTYQQNPVDTGRPTETFGDVLEVVRDAPGIEVLAVSLLHEPNAVDPVKVLKNSGPTVLHSQGPSLVMAELRAAMHRQGVALLPTPERAATAVAALVTDARQRWRRATPAWQSKPVPVSQYLPPGGRWDESSAKTLLAELEIYTPEREICASHIKAHAAFRRLGPPLAVKVLHPDVEHKTEKGGVHLNVHTLKQLDLALKSIDQTQGAHYLLERMVEDGPELLVGVRRDPAFGPIVVLGAGGWGAEVDNDFAIRLAPVSPGEARLMLSELAGARRYRGFRGAAAVDETELGRVIEILSQLIANREDIAELDINPLRVTGRGLCALDALVVAN